jgi:hypothetical protein
MPAQTQESKPAQNSNGLINNELALGDDRDFERIWWRIEIGLWTFLVAVLVLALIGLLGHGPLAYKELSTSDKALEIRYERIAHYKSPAILQVRVHPQVFRDGKAYLHLSRVTVHGMGAQRIIPQPEKSMPDDDGISYLFPPEDPSLPLIVSFALEPSRAGLFRQEVRTDPDHKLFFNSIVLP